MLFINVALKLKSLSISVSVVVIGKRIGETCSIMIGFIVVAESIDDISSVVVEGHHDVIREKVVCSIVCCQPRVAMLPRNIPRSHLFIFLSKLLPIISDFEFRNNSSSLSMSILK